MDLGIREREVAGVKADSLAMGNRDLRIWTLWKSGAPICQNLQEKSMKVLVVSNYTLIQQSLIALLQNLPLEEPANLSSCAASEAIEHVRGLAPDVILFEATTDDTRGISTVRTMNAEDPNTHIVVLGKDASEASVYEAISAGADGYVTCETSIDALASVLTGVTKGELGLSRACALRVVQQLRRALVKAPASTQMSLQVKLTPREQEVFDLVLQGVRSREISKRLVIAESTVYKHIQNILDKLNVHSRAQAIFMVDPEGGRSAPTGYRRVQRKRASLRSSAS